jgi:hypothetical protein
VLVHLACRQGDLPLLGASALLTLGSVLFKAQIAVLLIPTLLLWSVVFCQGISRRRRLVVAALLSAGLGMALWLASGFQAAPTIALANDWGRAYLASTRSMIPDEAVREVWVSLTHSGWLVPRVFLLLTGAFGALGLIYVPLLLARRSTREYNDHDLFPLCLLGVHVGLALGLAGNTNGVPWEIHHRPFVLVYLVLAVWCGGAVVALLPKPRGWGGRPEAWGVVLVLLLAAAPLLERGTTGTAERPPLLVDHLNTRVHKDHLACIDLIREHASPSDVGQASDNDPVLITSGLTELTPYLGAPHRLQRLDRYADLVTERLADLRELMEAATEEEFEAAVGRLPIRWYLLMPDSEVSWPPRIAFEPRFRCGDYRVYDLDEWRTRPGDR